MKWSTLGKGALKGLAFVYQHPEALEVIAASTGHPEIAAGIATVVAAREATKPAPLPVPPPPPAPTAERGPGSPSLPAPAVVPEVDLVGKWRGTLDRMAMEVLGHRMAEDELFHNAQLLEAGDVAGVTKNLQQKL